MVRKAMLDDIPAISELYREQFREMSKLIPDFIKEGDQSKDFLEKTILNDDSEYETLLKSFYSYEFGGDVYI